MFCFNDENKTPHYFTNASFSKMISKIAAIERKESIFLSAIYYGLLYNTAIKPFSIHTSRVDIDFLSFIAFEDYLNKIYINWDWKKDVKFDCQILTGRLHINIDYNPKTKVCWKYGF